MDPISRRLDELLKSDPHLAQPVAYYRALAILLRDGEPLATLTGQDQSTLQANMAAGQAMLAVSKGTGGQYAGMPLAWLAGLIYSIAMLRSKAFGKATAWVGIIGLGLLAASVPFAGYTTAEPTTAGVVAIVAMTYIGGGLLSLAWYILVSLRLLKLGRPGGTIIK